MENGYCAVKKHQDLVMLLYHSKLISFGNGRGSCRRLRRIVRIMNLVGMSLGQACYY